MKRLTASILRCSASALALLAPFPSRAELIAYWDFNSPIPYNVTVDKRGGHPGNVLGGAVLTPDAEGRSGMIGDRAARFGVAAQRIHVRDAAFLNVAGTANAMSASFWIKHVTVRGATVVSVVQPGATGTGGPRGFQTHAPWSNSIMYFDTAGCCDLGTQRLNSPTALMGIWATWHHVALVKNGDAKEIWLDGGMVASGTNTAPITSGFTEMFIGNSYNLAEAVNGDIDDLAIFSGGLTPTDISSLATGASPMTLAVAANDSDSDGLPDLWERTFFPGDLSQLGASPADKDGDGLADADELARGVNPTLTDSDGDGISDSRETGTGVWVNSGNTGTSPNTADTDGDGLSDGVETNTTVFVSPTNTGSNPLLADTDGDQIDDRLEILYGSNPNNASSTPVVPGVPTLLAWWKFDDDSTPAVAIDARVGYSGTMVGGAAYTPDAGGATGAAGDKGLNITAASQRLRVDNASWLNMGTRIDKLSYSFWQKLTSTPNSSSFWTFSTTAPNTQRGFQAHNPYGTNTIYFDTGGATAPGTRISGPPPGGHDWTTWHHYAFVKNGAIKEYYIDGVLVLSGNASTPLFTDFFALNIGGDGGTSSIRGTIDDFAIFAAVLSQQNVTDLATRAKTPGQVGTSADSDGDGLPDAWEYLYFPGDLTRLTATGDYDTDGSADTQELARTTDPTDNDTDDDGLKDGVETKTGIWAGASNTGTDPKKADTDGDGFLDGIEDASGVYNGAGDPGTNPNLADTDGDSFLDAYEGPYGANPNDAASRPVNAGQTTLLAWWPFNSDANPARTIDAVAGWEGGLQQGAFFSADGGGHSGVAGDRAACFDGTDDVVRVEPAGFISLAAPGDAITISFWQKLNVVQNSSSFWAVSPSSVQNQRGLQAHSPYGDAAKTVYFDHSGCCTTNVDRIFAPLPVAFDTAQWHHFVFLKSGNTKQIWIDGALLVDGLSAVPLKNDFTALMIGGGPAGFTNGCIDDFAIYAGGLTPDEINRLTEGESPASVPNWPASPFEITQIVRNPDNSVDLRWNSRPGKVYNVSGSGDLLSWSPLQSGVPSADTSTTTHLAGPFTGRQFFRISR